MGLLLLAVSGTCIAFSRAKQAACAKRFVCEHFHFGTSEVSARRTLFLFAKLSFFFFFFLKQNFVLIPSFNSAVATCLFCKCCSISNSIDAKTVAAPCLFGIVDFRASWQSDMVLCRMRRVKKETLRQTQAGVIHGLTLVSSFVLPILHLVQHYECISLPKRLCSKLP